MTKKQLKQQLDLVTAQIQELVLHPDSLSSQSIKLHYKRVYFLESALWSCDMTPTHNSFNGFIKIMK